MGSVDSVAWDKDGRKLVTGSLDNSAKIWTFPLPGKPIQWKWKYQNFNESVLTTTFLYADPTDIEKIILRELIDNSEENERLRNTLVDVDQFADDEAIKRYIESAHLGQLPRPTRLRQVRSIDQSKTLISLVWAPDLSRFVVSKSVTSTNGVYGAFELWSAGNSFKQTIGNAQQVAFDMSWSPDSSRFAIASRAYYLVGQVKVYDATTGKILYQLAEGDAYISKVAWNSSGTRLATGSSNGIVCVWDALAGKLLSKSEVHQTGIRCLAFSPDESRIASASNDGSVRLLDGENAEEMLSLAKGLQYSS